MRYAFMFLLAGLIGCAPVFPEELCAVACEAGTPERIPAWAKPGSPFVVKALDCGQRVMCIRFKKDYVEIQVDGLTGYVKQKYIRFLKNMGDGTSLLLKTQSSQAASSFPGDRPDADRDQKKFGIALGVSPRTVYEEPGIMEERGKMVGVSFDFASRLNKFMVKFDSRFTVGNVDYASDRADFMWSIRNYNVETRIAFGRDFQRHQWRFTPYLGLGFRYLFDDPGGRQSDAYRWGYDRESRYFYSPIGLETEFHLKPEWFLYLTGEYDWFWHGWQHSHLEDVYPQYNTLKNKQHGGWGARESIRLMKDLGRCAFFIESSFRYWNIDNSDIAIITLDGVPVGRGIEPFNQSRELSFGMGMRF
jgi:hypothetical protein